MIPPYDAADSRIRRSADPPDPYRLAFSAIWHTEVQDDAISADDPTTLGIQSAGSAVAACRHPVVEIRHRDRHIAIRWGAGGAYTPLEPVRFS